MVAREEPRVSQRRERRRVAHTPDGLARRVARRLEVEEGGDVVRRDAAQQVVRRRVQLSAGADAADDRAHLRCSARRRGARGGA